MQKEFKPVPRQENLVVQELDGETLIYDLTENKAFCLNETSALVWQSCDGKKNVTDLSRELSVKLNVPASEDLIWLALDQLKKENLIESKEDFEINFNALSRREAIRKVGIASLIALPIITSLVAPVAAQSGSDCNRPTGRSNSCPCTTSSQCNSGCCDNDTRSRTFNTCVNTAGHTCHSSLL